MRTLDNELITKQQSASKVPYMRISFTDGVDTYTYTTRDGTNRIVGRIEQWEEPYAGVAIVRLKNHDGHFTALDLEGFAVTVGWGYELTGSPGSTWYANAADMKVLMQRDISYSGECLTEFYCVSPWAAISQNCIMQGGKKLSGVIVGTFELAEAVTNGDGASGRVAAVGTDWIVVTRVSGTFADTETATGGTSGATLVIAGTPADNYGILVYAAGETTTEARIEALTGKTVDVDEDDDLGSMADTPALSVDVGTSNRLVIRRMLLRSKCGMRFENDGHFHVLYLDTTDAAQYEFDSAHAFFLDIRERALIMPNTVYVVSGLLDVQNVPAYIGTANDATSVTKLGTIVAPFQVDPDAASQADVDNRAVAWIAQQLAEANQGVIEAPMECGLEVYDMVQVVDSRLNATSKGRIGRVERIYEPQQGIYAVHLRLGSLYSEPGAMNTGPGSIESDLKDLTSNLNRTPPTIPFVNWALVLPKAIQGYQHNITFTASDYDTVAWSSGTVKFYDGTTQAVAAGNTGNLATASIYYIYFDLEDANPNVLKSTTDYQSVMTEKTGLVCMVQRASDAAMLATVIPSYGKTPLITADIINMTGIKEWDFGGGLKLQAILDTQIQAGYIHVSADTSFASGYDPTGKEVAVHRGSSAPGDTSLLWFDTTTGQMKAYVGAAWVVLEGEWYDKSGVVISANSGIDIYGTDMAFTISSAVGAITAFGTNGADQVTATVASHGLLTGDRVNISGTTNYNGNYIIYKIDANTFWFSHTWLGDDATGTCRKVQVYAGSDGYLYAGGGSVLLDATGAHFIGQGYCKFFSGATFVGYIEAASTTQLKVSTYDTGMDLLHYAHDDATLQAGDVVTLSAGWNIVLIAGGAINQQGVDFLIDLTNDMEILCDDRFSIGTGGIDPSPGINQLALYAGGSLEIGSLATVFLFTDTTTCDLDAHLTSKDIGSVTEYDEIYCDHINTTGGVYDNYDDLALLKSIKSDPHDPTKIDSKSLPSILKYDKASFMAKAEAKLIDKENRKRDILSSSISKLGTRLVEIEQQKSLLTSQRDKLTGKDCLPYDQALLKLGKKIQNDLDTKSKLQEQLSSTGLDRAEKLLAWEQRQEYISQHFIPLDKTVSLLLGSVKQVADKLDSIESRIAILEARR